MADDTKSLVGAAEMLPSDNAVLSETAAIAEIATSQIALDITLLCQRSGRSTETVMARMLGARVGRLDSLMRGNEATGVPGSDGTKKREGS